MPEEQQSDTHLPAPPKPSGGRRRGHRGGRGRRRPVPIPSPAEKEIFVAESPAAELRELPESPREKEFNGSAITRAVAEVTQVVESLRQTLAQMEEVLELVELAERQKLGDEREIESLHRALRKLHQPPRHEPRERHQREERQSPED